MGCFDLSCCVSGLPIRYNDPVMFFLLARNLSARQCTHGVDGRWVARTFPLTARYNDYGSVEEVEEGPLRDVVMEGLAKDLVEKGMGDNVCHDVATRRDMSFDALLRALWEGRVDVRSRWGGRRGSATREEMLDSGKDAEPGAPTMRRIEDLIVQAGHAVAYNVDGNWNLPSGYIVDLVDRDEVSVRYFGGFGRTVTETAAQLEKLLPLFTEYAAVLWPYDHDEAEIRLRPRVGVKYHRPRRYFDATMEVKQAMIRRDVWDEILKMRLPESWYKNDGKTVGVENYVRGVRRTWIDLSKPQGLDAVLERLSGASGLNEHYGAVVLAYLGGEGQHAGGSVALHDHGAMLMRKKLTRAQVRHITRRAGEFAFVRAAMNYAGRYWQPSHHSPGQCTPPHPALALQEAIIRVARKVRRKYDREREE